MLNLQVAGKFIDQPNLVRKLHKSMPVILVSGAAAYGIKDTLSAPKEKRTKKFIKNTMVLGSTVASALIAVRGMTLGKIKIPGLVKTPEFTASKAIDDFISANANKLKTETQKLLKKSKENVLGFREIKKLKTDLEGTPEGKELFNRIIPPFKDLSGKEIAGEIGRLSLLGAIPVVGGVLGGTAACVATGEKGEKLKNCTKNKLNEGLYQYLANIVLCNVGAAGALGMMEIPKVKDFLKVKNINSKLVRIGAMLAGIAATGVIGGSAMANFIGKKVINPLFNKGVGKNQKGVSGNELKNLYSERRPEAIDVALHSDDIATVGVMSGFKWIEPALPIMYSISGYRAGMGYRNCKKKAEC